MNIHLKIEAKRCMMVTPTQITKAFINSPNIKKSEVFKIIYRVFNTDSFLLPYKVQKLSKKARKNKNQLN